MACLCWFHLFRCDSDALHTFTTLFYCWLDKTNIWSTTAVAMGSRTWRPFEHFFVQETNSLVYQSHWSLHSVLVLFPFLPQHAVGVSTSLPHRTFSAPAARRTASMTAKAPGAATARTATTERSPTPRLWPARVSLPSQHSTDYMCLNCYWCKRRKQLSDPGVQRSHDVFHNSSSASDVCRLACLLCVLAAC